ncbi:hypothetical protein EV368DRAFT_87947 [Lentinula lateritia]|nr:hypothetical protein EV368DRAFT_87947 [Lentinula lateritia]
MSAPNRRSRSRTRSPLLPIFTTLGKVPSPGLDSDGEVEQDQLAFTIEFPSRPQLQLFETVFNTGKPLSGYCQDDPLWPLLAEVASPCSNCSKSPDKCKVLLNSPRCTNCSAKKTCSLGKVLRYRYFARRCNQDPAYSRRFLELHGTPAHQSTWGIPLSVWRRYDVALHARTSSTSTLLELNMLDEQDAADADQQELREFLALQQGEAVVAAKRKRDRSPLPIAGPSSKRVRSDASKKRSRRRSPEEEAVQESPLRVRLVVPPGRSVVASTSTPLPPRASPSLMEVPGGDLPVQGHSSLVRLAAVAEAQSGLVQQPVAPPSIKGPPFLQYASCFSSHPEQLRSSRHEVLEHETEYCRVLDQFVALEEALPGTPGQSLLEHFRKMQKDLRDAVRERKVAVEKLSSSTHRNSQLMTTLLYQQGRVDESNALATRQRHLVEELQEEVHHARDRATFVEQMVKEYPDEGYYEVVLPPLSQLEGDLNKAREDLRRVATLAHRLHRSDPATVLHHHHCYIGVIIEAVVAFLRRGLESEDPDLATHNFRLALDYMQAARGVHSDLYIQSISSVQWFFNNAVDEDEGLYRLVSEHSQFDNDSPFLTAAQHAGFAPPPDNSLESPLHRHMLALSTALPHSDGVGRWDDLVPALPSVDQLTSAWEQLMLGYIHHVTDVPLSGMDTQVPMSSVEPGTESLAEVTVEQFPEAPPLFLPEQEPPTSPSPPPPSPTLPPLFGSVANLAIDLTGDDDELYETEGSRMGRVSVPREVVDLAAVPGIIKEEPL